MWRNQPSFILGGNHVLQCGHDFSIRGGVIPVVTEYKYLGCVVDEFLDLNTMVDDRAEADRKALGSLLQEAQAC